MAEAGGPTTQEGIYYQNSLAALQLAELLSLEPRPPREQVIEVRVEAPAHVDDIVVSYSDGHRDWFQAKSQLRGAGQAWVGLWQAVSTQLQDSDFGGQDRLVLALGRHSGLASDLQAIIECAQVPTEAEWRLRLGAGLSRRLAAIEAALPNGALAHDLVRYVELRVITQNDIEAAFRRLDLWTLSAVPQQFRFSRTLRAVVLVTRRAGRAREEGRS